MSRVDAPKEPQGQPVVFAAFLARRVRGKVYGCLRPGIELTLQFDGSPGNPLMEQDKPTPNLKAAIRQLAIMRGQISCFQRGCTELMNLAGEAPAAVTLIPETPTEKAGEAAFELMIYAQGLQAHTQALANQLREQAGMPPVGPTENQAAVGRMLEKTMEEIKNEIKSGKATHTSEVTDQ